MTTSKNEPVSEDTAPLASDDIPTPKAASAKPKAAAKPAPEPVAAPRARVAVKDHVVSGGDTDPVSYSRITPEGRVKTRKSLTVHQLQRRLVWLGFDLAGADLDGTYGAFTTQSVQDWQEANGYEATGDLTREQFAAVFEGDPNVTVSLA